ncbi:hypothetical protein D3C71_1950570 [compost metagenome]
MRIDLVQEDEVADAKRDDGDDRPNDDIADDAGQIDRAFQAPHAAAGIVKHRRPADDEPLHVIRKHEQRQTERDDAQEDPDNPVADDIADGEIRFQLQLLHGMPRLSM